MNTQPTPETDEALSTAECEEDLVMRMRRMEGERDEAREQRDRLAEALRYTVSRINDYEQYKAGNRRFPPIVNATLDFANLALQSLTPNV